MANQPQNPHRPGARASGLMAAQPRRPQGENTPNDNQANRGRAPGDGAINAATPPRRGRPPKDAAPAAAQGAAPAQPRRGRPPKDAAQANATPAQARPSAPAPSAAPRPAQENNRPKQERKPTQNRPPVGVWRASDAQPAAPVQTANQPDKGQRRPMPRRISPHVPISGAPSVSASIQMVGRKPAASQATAHPSKGTLRVIPLGGMCEVGKNMTCYEYGNDLIIVDCGQSFPDESMPGVDAVIPDFSYVLQNRDRVRGIFLTHGHEDHIGAMPWLLQQIQAPVYGGRMTCKLVEYKLEDRVPGLSKSAELHVVADGQTVHCGCFTVEFIHVNHSIADASMLAIRTPVGYVMHSGDFKIDYTPIYGGIINLQRIAEIGREGVLLFVCESTNIEIRGHSVSERHVGDSFSAMFASAPGRIFVATFSSNSYRLQQIFTAAEKLGRKVALVGRSMLNVFNAANSLGYIQMKPDTLIDINQIDNYPPEQVVVISTGSQGEPMSALTRIAFSSHREVEILRGDTVIISASPIPGNEKPVYKVINELYKRGAKVYYAGMADVHASGHAYRDELRLVQTLIKPRYLIPAHGEYRMLYQQAELAHELGTPWEDIFLLSNGDIFEISRGKARIAGFTNGAAVLIDGASIGDIDNTVLRERKLLSDDGVVSVSVVLRKKTGELAAPPVVHCMGFLYESEYEQVIADCERRAVAFVLRMQSQNRQPAECVRGGQLRDQLRTFLFEKTRRRPVVMVSLSEV